MERQKDKLAIRQQRQAEALKERGAESNRLATLAKRALRRLTANVSHTNRVSEQLGYGRLSKNSARALQKFSRMLDDISVSRELIEFKAVNTRRKRGAVQA